MCFPPHIYCFEYLGGSMRGSDRSMRRDIDDIALSNHLSKSGSRQFAYPGTQQPLTGYGRKDMDDMVRSHYRNKKAILLFGINVLKHLIGDIDSI